MSKTLEKDELNKKRVKFTVFRLGRIAITRGFLGIVFISVLSYFSSTFFDYLFDIQYKSPLQKHSEFMLTYFFPIILLFLAIYLIWEESFSKNRIVFNGLKKETDDAA